MIKRPKTGRESYPKSFLKDIVFTVYRYNGNSYIKFKEHHYTFLFIIFEEAPALSLPFRSWVVTHLSSGYEFLFFPSP